MNAFAFLLALSALQSVLAAYPESLPESGARPGDEKDATATETITRARGGKPLRGDAEETGRGLGGGWGGSKDTDSPTMFPTLAPTISPTLSPTLFPTVSPTFCGKAAKASGDYYYSGKSSKSSGSRMAGPARSARDRARARQEIRERERQAAWDREMSLALAEGREPMVRNSKSSKSGSGSKSSKSDRAVDGVAAAGVAPATGFKIFPGGSRRLVRGGDTEGEGWRPAVDSESERAEPAAGFEPDSVRRRRINRAV